MKLKKLLKFARERSWSIEIDGDGCTEVFNDYDYKIGEGATPKQAIKRAKRAYLDEADWFKSRFELIQNEKLEREIKNLIAALEKYRGQINNEGKHTAS